MDLPAALHASVFDMYECGRERGADFAKVCCAICGSTSVDQHASQNGRAAGHGGSR
jgi:hypothetical protein